MTFIFFPCRLKRMMLFFIIFAFAFLSGCSKTTPSGSAISKIDDLNHHSFTIGCMTGIVATREAHARLPHANFLEYSMPVDAFTAICAGKIDAVVLDRPTLEFISLAHPEMMVMQDDLALGHISVAASKSNPSLMRQVNEFIQSYRTDGTCQSMYDRWFRMKQSAMPEIPPPPSPSGVLRIGVTANNEPLCFIKDNSLAGFDTEFALRLASFLNKKIEFKDMTYDALIPALVGGKIDLAIAFMDAMPEREESVLFSENYIDAPIAILIHRSLYAGSSFSSAIGGNDSAACSGVAQFFSGSARSLWNSFNKTFIRESRWKLILQGLITTIVITVFSVIVGTFLALPVCMMSRSKNKVLSWISDRYVSLMMGTPILVILMILYYIIFAKVNISAVFVAILAFGMDFSAYTSVTLRAGIDGIPRSQTEAALALGYSPSAAFFRFILPQAVRRIMPVYRGEVISTLKATSIVGFIAIMDLTKMGDIIRSRTYEAFFPLIAIAAVYFFTAKALTSFLLILENKLNPDNRRKYIGNRGAS